MLIIYGTRWCGVVDDCDGQHQQTRFAHLYWMPLFPVATMWVTGQVAGGQQGHKARWSWRSVLAGYLRCWGPVVALFGLARWNLDGALVATIAASLTAWSWSWRALHGARARRRSDLHAAHYGTRCDPLRMPRQLAYSLRSDVDRRWAEASNGRTPEDIARLGSSDPAEVALAYATLRLVARTAVGAAAAQARATSDRLLDAATPRVDATAAGPYRSDPSAAPAARVPGIVDGTRFEA
jgi:hypothetical protein